MAKNYTLGKLAVLKIAPVVGNTTDLASIPVDQLKHFCLTNEIKLAIDGTETTFENFCSGGTSVKVPTGDEASLSVGAAQWVVDDQTLLWLEDAKRNHTELWFVYWPAGEKGGIGYFGRMNVKKWELTTPSGGLSTVAHDLNPVGIPERFGRESDKYTGPGVAATDTAPATALTNGTATPLAATAAGQSLSYTLTTSATGDVVVLVDGASAPRTVTVKDASGNTLATGTDSVTAAAAPAGQYTVEVSGSAASTGGTITASYIA